MPRCSFPQVDINWSSIFSIHMRISMRSCTTRTLHGSQAIAIPGYAAQVSVRAGSVIAHLASLNSDGPYQPYATGRAAVVQLPGKWHLKVCQYEANRALLYRMAKALLGTRDLDEVATSARLAKFTPVAIP